LAVWTVVAAVLGCGTAAVLPIGTGLVVVGEGGVLIVRAGSQFNPVRELEPVAGTPLAVWCWDALQDDQTRRAQDRDRPGGGVFGDPDPGGDVADTDGRDPALLGVMGGEGQVLEGGPGQRT
jgi:hypothetical protein